MNDILINQTYNWKLIIICIIGMFIIYGWMWFEIEKYRKEQINGEDTK